VTAIICAAGDLDESAAARGLARRHEEVYFMAGVHPHAAKDVAGDYLAAVERLSGDAKNVAIGEIGLDYHYDFSTRDVQRRVFAEQLELARRLGKPVVIHMREAFDDTLAILRRSGADPQRVVFHSFTEGPSAARAVLDLGATVSFSGIVTFKNADELRQAARITPARRLLIETDAPYLSPEPVRKMKTNEPANVAHVAAFLAGLLATPPEELAQQTMDNAVSFFAIRSVPRGGVSG